MYLQKPGASEHLPDLDNLGGDVLATLKSTAF